LDWVEVLSDSEVVLSERAAVGSEMVEEVESEREWP